MSLMEMDKLGTFLMIYWLINQATLLSMDSEEAEAALFNNLSDIETELNLLICGEISGRFKWGGEEEESSPE